MRSIIGTLLLVSGIVIMGIHRAAAQQAGDVQAVETANQAFYEAASALDVAQMDAVWAHEPYVRAIHPGWPIEKGWDAVRAGWVSLFSRFSEVEVAMSDPQMRVNGDTAWVVGEESFRARLLSGREVHETLLATSVFERVGSAWLMVHHHVSGLPLKP